MNKISIPNGKKVEYSVTEINRLQHEDGEQIKKILNTRILLDYKGNNIIEFNELKKPVKDNKDIFDCIDEVVGTTYEFKVSDNGEIQKLNNSNSILEKIEKSKLDLLTLNLKEASGNLAAVLKYEDFLKNELSFIVFKTCGLISTLFIPLYNRALDNQEIEINIGDLIMLNYIPIALNTQTSYINSEKLLIKVEGTINEKIVSENKFKANLREFNNIKIWEKLDVDIKVSGYYIFNIKTNVLESFKLSRKLEINSVIKENIHYGYRIKKDNVQRKTKNLQEEVRETEEVKMEKYNFEIFVFVNRKVYHGSG